MKYTDEEMLSEILKRSVRVCDERRRRACRYLAGAGAALLIALITAISYIPERMAGSYTGGSLYGSLMLGREAGGYILAAVIAFALGVVVTLLCQRLRGHDAFPGTERSASGAGDASSSLSHEL